MTASVDLTFLVGGEESDSNLCNYDFQINPTGSQVNFVKLDRNESAVSVEAFSLVKQSQPIYPGWFNEGTAKFFGAWTKEDGLRYLKHDGTIGIKGSCEGFVVAPAVENKLCWERCSKGILPFSKDEKFTPFPIGRSEDHISLYFGRLIKSKADIGVVRYNGEKFVCHVVTQWKGGIGQFDDFEVLCLRNWG